MAEVDAEVGQGADGVEGRQVEGLHVIEGEVQAFKPMEVLKRFVGKTLDLEKTLNKFAESALWAFLDNPQTLFPSSDSTDSLVISTKARDSTSFIRLSFSNSLVSSENLVPRGKKNVLLVVLKMCLQVKIEVLET